jgi:curved DNA-binding protein
MKPQDYYAVLGVSRTASAEEIQRAFRLLARKYHPDVSKEPGADARFKQVNEAYDTLKDPQRRKLYDQYGSDWKAAQTAGVNPDEAAARSQRRGRSSRSGRSSSRPSSGFGAPDSSDFSSFGGQPGGANYADMFDDLFGQAGKRRQSEQSSPDEDAFSRGFRAAASALPKGANLEASVTIPLIDAHRGTSRTFTLSRDGAGISSLDVRIPPGTLDNSVLRLAGQGHPGQGGPGDLLVRVRIAPDPKFTFRLDDAGRPTPDLITPVLLAPWEAALGAKIDVPTLEGTVTLGIPAGSSSGQRLRLRERGFAKRTPASGQGDLYAELTIVIPKTLTPEQTRLFSELRDASPDFKPRAQ